MGPAKPSLTGDGGSDASFTEGLGRYDLVLLCRFHKALHPSIPTLFVSNSALDLTYTYTFVPPPSQSGVSVFLAEFGESPPFLEWTVRVVEATAPAFRFRRRFLRRPHRARPTLRRLVGDAVRRDALADGRAGHSGVGSRDGGGEDENKRISGDATLAARFVFLSS